MVRWLGLTPRRQKRRKTSQCSAGRHWWLWTRIRDTRVSSASGTFAYGVSAKSGRNKTGRNSEKQNKKKIPVWRQNRNIEPRVCFPCFFFFIWFALFFCCLLFSLSRRLHPALACCLSHLIFFLPPLLVHPSLASPRVYVCASYLWLFVRSPDPRHPTTTPLRSWWYWSVPCWVDAATSGALATPIHTHAWSLRRMSPSI